MTKISLRIAMFLGATFAWVFCAPNCIVHAADHNNLEAGIPTQVEDAYAIPYLGREVQGYTAYDRTRDHKDLFVTEPVLEYGFARNWQGTLGIPYRYGDSHETTGSGNVQIGALYNFNTESLSMPAFAIAVREELPGGQGHAGVNSQIKFIATKTLGPGDHLDELHINLIYLNTGQPDDDIRRNRYQAILGYSRRIGIDNVLVSDFVRSQEQFKGQNSNVIEIGIRHQATPQTLYAIGIGAGIGQDSPRFRTTLGFQHSY